MRILKIQCSFIQHVMQSLYSEHNSSALHNNNNFIEVSTQVTFTLQPGNFLDSLDKYSRRQQVTCFPPYPSKVTLITILLPSNARETKLVICWKLLSLGRPNPKTSPLLGKWRHAFFENTPNRHHANFKFKWCSNHWTRPGYWQYRIIRIQIGTDDNIGD